MGLPLSQWRARGEAVKMTESRDGVWRPVIFLGSYYMCCLLYSGDRGLLLLNLLHAQAEPFRQ